MVHLTSRQWIVNMKDDVFSLQVFNYTTSMIDDKMMWMFKILCKNVTIIKLFQI